MKIISVEPKPDHAFVAVVEGTRGVNPTVPYYDKLVADDPDRATGLSTLRTRLHQLVVAQRPDLVLIKPLESQALQAKNRKYIQSSWFSTAEVRGVCLEAARAAGAAVETRDGAAVSRTIGDRAGREYVEDDTFWNTEVDTRLSNKSYRVAVLMAISALRERA